MIIKNRFLATVILILAVIVLFISGCDLKIKENTESDQVETTRMPKKETTKSCKETEVETTQTIEETTAESMEVKLIKTFTLASQPISNANITGVTLNQNNEFVSANFIIQNQSTENLQLVSLSLDLYNSDGVLLGTLQKFSVNVSGSMSLTQSLMGNVYSSDDNLAVDRVELRAS